MCLKKAHYDVYSGECLDDVMKLEIPWFDKYLKGKDDARNKTTRFSESRFRRCRRHGITMARFCLSRFYFEAFR